MQLLGFSKVLRPLYTTVGSVLVPLLAAEEKDDADLELAVEEKVPLPASFKSLTEEIWTTSIDSLQSARAALSVTFLPSLWAALKPTILLNSGNLSTHPTAWLDGLRGLGALAVFLHHGAEICYAEYHGMSSWVADDPHFFKLPIIRIFYNAASLVTVFFVISGYALSYRPLLSVGKQDHLKIFNTLASSVFRRGIRLYLPCAFVGIVCAFTFYFDLWHPAAKSKEPRAETLLGTLSWWFNVMLYGINPFLVDKQNLHASPLGQLEPVMWTIPFEYRGSIVVFALILALSKTRRSLRIGTLGCVLLYVVLVAQWDIFLFVGGMLCCEAHLVFPHTADVESSEKESDEPRKKDPVRSILSTVCPIFGLLVIFYVFSQPERYWQNGDSPFYDTMDTLAPGDWKNNPDTGRFWQCLAAVSWILLSDHCVIVRRPLTYRFTQYLGQVSFSFYLIHPLLLNTIGRRVKDAIYGWTLQYGEGMIRELISLGLVSLIFVPIVFWVADLMTRYVDRPSMAFASYVKQRYNGEDETPQLVS